MNEPTAPQPLPRDALADATLNTETKPDTLMRAIRWSSEAYRTDHPEYDAFWKWFDARGLKDMTRTDSEEILRSVPKNFEPKEVPPPLRAEFAKLFGRDEPTEQEPAPEKDEKGRLLFRWQR